MIFLLLWFLEFESTLAKMNSRKSSIGPNNPTSWMDHHVSQPLEQETRRLIKGGGVKINNQSIADEKLIITKDLFKDNNFRLSLGKKRHIKVVLS